jgi:hypothetical protein
MSIVQCQGTRELTADKVLFVYSGRPDEYFMKRAEARGIFCGVLSSFSSEMMMQVTDC